MRNNRLKKDQVEQKTPAQKGRSQPPRQEEVPERNLFLSFSMYFDYWTFGLTFQYAITATSKPNIVMIQLFDAGGNPSHGIAAIKIPKIKHNVFFDMKVV